MSSSPSHYNRLSLVFLTLQQALCLYLWIDGHYDIGGSSSVHVVVGASGKESSDFIESPEPLSFSLLFGNWQTNSCGIQFLKWPW